MNVAMAGLQASAPATSSSSGFATDSNFKSNFFDTIKRIKGPSFTRNNNQSGDKAVGLAKQGVLNLFSLLKARYTTIEQKKQLAILFSLISSDDRLQPTAEIKSLLGEVDNGKITAVKLEGLLDRDVSQIDARSSSHRGGGYSYNERPTVTIDPPPSLGDEYKPAKLEPVMEQTSRILRIRVLDGGKGPRPKMFCARQLTPDHKPRLFKRLFQMRTNRRDSDITSFVVCNCDWYAAPNSGPNFLD